MPLTVEFPLQLNSTAVKPLLPEDTVGWKELTADTGSKQLRGMVRLIGTSKGVKIAVTQSMSVSYEVGVDASK